MRHTRQFVNPYSRKTYKTWRKIKNPLTGRLVKATSPAGQLILHLSRECNRRKSLSVRGTRR